MNESTAQGKVGKGVRKRKHPHQDSSNSGDEYTPSGTMAKASTSHTLCATNGTSLHRHHHVNIASCITHPCHQQLIPPPPSTHQQHLFLPSSGTAPPPKANRGPVVKNRCAPTIGGLAEGGGRHEACDQKHR